MPGSPSRDCGLMPIIDTLLKMSLYVSLVLIVPGPTNTLLLSSGLKSGVRNTWPLIIAEALGYVASISAWGFFLHAFAANHVWIVYAVKIASSAYILYLAISMWRRSAIIQNSSMRLVSLHEMFITTLTNPKAFIFASALFPPEAFQTVHYYAWSFAVFLIVLVPIGATWSGLGRFLALRKSVATHATTVLRGVSLVLLTFSGTLFYSAIYR